MPEYIFYKISCCDPNVTEFYIGSTKDFTKRKSVHKHRCINENNKTKQYVFMREQGGWDNWQMNPIDKQLLATRIDARIYERKLTDEHQATLNTNNAYTSDEEKKECNKEYQKAYRQTDEHKEYQKAYQKEYQKAYQQTDKYKAYQKAYQKKAYHAKKKLNSFIDTENNIDAL